jgi:hypothetical protein
MAAYRGETKGEAVLRAQAFLDAIRNRAAIQTPQTEEAKAVEAPETVLIDAKAAAKELQVGVRMLHKLRKRGLPFVKVGRLVKYNLEALRDWARANLLRTERQKSRTRERYGISTEYCQKKGVPCNVTRHFGAQ